MKITHTIEWEPLQGNYRILRLTGSTRQPTIAEAREYMNKHDLPTEIWVCGFYNSGEWCDASEARTLELWEYTGHGDGVCPVCANVLDLFHNVDKCPVCGKMWAE
jgi:rubrerythrin